MSLILEALKKSEQQRRLGEAPTLGSPMLVARKRRSLLPVFAVLIVGAVAAGWWLGREPATGMGDAAPDAAATKPPAQDAAAASKVQAGTPAPVAANPPAAAHPHPLQAPPARPAPNANPATSLPPANRAPVPAPTAPAVQPPAPAAPTAPPPAVPAKPSTARVPPSAPGTPSAAAPSAATPAPSPSTTPPAAAARMPPSAPARPAEPALPSIWDLPYATRKDLPELQLTMHLYSSDPAERFVVIKGERHVEGDDLGDGVVLRDIRADGMVLEYKGQRFVYPRDGR